MNSGLIRLSRRSAPDLGLAGLAVAGAAAAWLQPSPASILLAAVLAALCFWLIRQRRAHTPAADLQRIVVEHRMLRESVENNPMPYAVYDADDRLIAYNKAYAQTHAEAFRRLRHLADARELRYGDLVRITAESTLPADQVEAHIAERVRRQRQADGGGVDREYPGLGWMRVCKFATPSGAVAGFAVDINELKRREAALQEQIARAQDLERQLRDMADTDALTGLANRRAFLERAEAEFRRARRYGHPLCAAMLDVDAFKQVNDRHGHGAGDAVLAGVAGAIGARLREGLDSCGRLGGEEFAALLPETTLEGALALAERLRAAIGELGFEGAGGRFGVTISIGVAALDGGDGSFAALLARADGALYEAKRGGRNRVNAA